MNEWESFTEKMLSAWETDIEHGSTHIPASLVPNSPHVFERIDTRW